MRSSRVFLTLPGILVWVAIAAPATFGDERFQWRGQVDGTDEISIRGRRVRIRHLEAQPIQKQDYRFTDALPRHDVEVVLNVVEGRGRVRLMEQPSSRNDYTAVVRIEDDSSGDSYYEFELVWETDDWDDWDDWAEEDTDRWEEPDLADGSFFWQGRVDIGAVIEIRGESHRVEDLGGQGTRERRAYFDEALPERDVAVSLHKREGRGEVRLVQTPSARNHYTALVRIDDDKGGADDYEFELRWR